MRILLAAALAAILAPAPGYAAPPAQHPAQLCFGFGIACRDDNVRDQSTNFDLGVDVSNVPPDKQSVAEFMATQSAEGQHILVTTCRHYLGNLSQVQSPRTIQFCRVLVGS